MNKTILALIPLLSLSVCCFSQVDQKATIRTALTHIYNMQFEKADSIIQLYRQDFKDHPSGYLLTAYYLRWKHLPISSEDAAYDSYINLLDSTIEVSDQYLEKNGNDIFIPYFKMSAHIMKAELLSNNGDFFKSVMEGKKALPYVKQGFNLYNENPEFYVSTGLYNYYIEAYREKSFFHRSLLFAFAQGNQEEGLKHLKSGYEKGIFTSTESLVYLAHINFKRENDKWTGLKYAKQLHDEFPANLKFAEMYVENLLACGKYEEARNANNPLLETQSDYYKIRGLLFKGILDLEEMHNLTSASKNLEAASTLLKETTIDEDHIKSLIFLHQARIANSNNEPEKRDNLIGQAKKYAKYAYVIKKIDNWNY